MQRPKNFLLLVVLISVVTVALVAAVFYTAHRSLTPSRTAPSATTDRLSSSPAPVVVVDAPPASTPSAAAQKRAKEFNDATNRFNAPDGQ